MHSRLTGGMRAQAERMRSETMAALCDLQRVAKVASEFGETDSVTVVAANVRTRWRPLRADEVPDGMRTVHERAWRVAVPKELAAKANDRLRRLSDSALFNVVGVEEDPVGQASGKYLLVVDSKA
ncbi:MAG: hypothetical protein KIT11_05420 [Fimbriimonadaceae bacterium]|nr:hypothetical protein [Fimbriimonadaceae bacterium]QYK56668.1 MAG: hypothetical protein KF733_04100 [Fimbriimonadaceae bacterium]